MVSEIDPTLERGYRYQAGWGSLGCALLLLLTLGSGGIALTSYAMEQIENGRMVLGITALVIGALASSSFVFLILGVVAAVRSFVSPPELRLSPSGLHLPANLRGTAPKSEEGAESDSSRQPEEIPFQAIRWVRRESGAIAEDDRLMIVHELSPVTLEIRQSMMRRGEFEELETVLRTAVPNAFTAAPTTLDQTPL